MSDNLVSGSNGIPSNFKSEVLEVPQGWDKLCSDSLSYKKEQKYKKARKIPSGEEILVYTKPLPLFAPVAIFTDLALYTDIAGRIPYVSLPRYTIEMEGSKDAVFLADVDNDIKIIDSSLVMTNTIGEAVRGFLATLQSYICERYEWAKQECRAACGAVLEKARVELRHGPLSRRNNNAIYSFQLRTASSDEAYLFRAEEVFRWGDMEDYQKFIDTLPVYYVTPEMQQKIRVSQPIFETNLLNDIGDLNNNYDEYQASFIRDRLSNNGFRSDALTQIYGYAAARLNDTTAYLQALNSIKDKLGDGAAVQLDAFRGMYFNHRMSFLYEKIDRGEDLNNSEIKWTDSLGLKPIHYAIMLEKDYNYVKKLLEIELPEDPENLTWNDDDYNLIIHPLVFCVCANADAMIWSGIIRQTSKTYKELKKAKAALEIYTKYKRFELSIQKKILSKQRDLYRQALRKHDDDAIQEIRDLMDEQKDIIKGAEAEIDELEEEIKNADAEMEEFVQKLYQRICFIASFAIARGKNDLPGVISRIANDSALLQQLFTVDYDNCIRYTFQNKISYILPSGFSMNIPGTPIKRAGTYEDATLGMDDAGTKHAKEAEEKVATYSKQYGDSWFSPDAHHDVKTLNAEYRNLAKIYHPDLNSDARSTSVMQSIVAERTELLEKMTETE